MTVVILGGTSLVVSYLLPRLERMAVRGLIVARRPVHVPDGFGFEQVDILETESWTPPGGAVVISALPLPVLVRALPRLVGVGSIIALGSTSRFSKRQSADAHERATASALERAEADLAGWSARNGVGFTVLRPTLVYDGAGDRNIARMGRFIRRFRFLVLARPAAGLRQPIHADDVAGALAGAIGNTGARNRAFDIGGGEVLTYRAMAERVFEVEGVRPRLLLLPEPWLRAGFRLAQLCGIVGNQGFGSSVFQRMNQHLVFDTAEGLDVLGYAPRRFEPRPPEKPA